MRNLLLLLLPSESGKNAHLQLRYCRLTRLGESLLSERILLALRCRMVKLTNGSRPSTDDIALFAYQSHTTSDHTTHTGLDWSAVSITSTAVRVREWKVKVKVLYRLAVNGNIPWHSYGVSLAIWDHTVLPATRHKWTHPAFTPAMQAGTRFTYPGGMEGWVDLVDLIAPRLGVEPATFRSRVQRSTTASPRQPLLFIRHQVTNLDIVFLQRCLYSHRILLVCTT